jgi:hypothetical protein
MSEKLLTAKIEKQASEDRRLMYHFPAKIKYRRNFSYSLTENFPSPGWKNQKRKFQHEQITELKVLVFYPLVISVF